MKYYEIAFSGMSCIEAEDAQDAQRIFWNCINADQPLPINVYCVEGIAECDD